MAMTSAEIEAAIAEGKAAVYGNDWSTIKEGIASSTKGADVRKHIYAEAHAASLVVEEVADELDYIVTRDENLFNKYDVVANTHLNDSSGEEETNYKYDTSGWIPVKSGTIYTLGTLDYTTSGTSYPTHRVHTYNANKEHLSYFKGNFSSYATKFHFTTNDDCAYVRICFESGTNVVLQNLNTTVLIESSTTITEYIPYYTAYDRLARSGKITNLGTSYTFDDLDNAADNSIYYLSPSNITNYPTGLTTASYIATISLNDKNKIQICYDAYGNYYASRACVKEDWKDWIINSDVITEKAQEALDDTYATSSVALFEKVGCCGDSFTAGCLYNKESTTYYDPDFPEHGIYTKTSYPAVMGRLYGIETTAFAKAGLTSTQWRTDAAGLPALLAADPQDLYIISLGLNDCTDDKVPAGEEADIDTEPETPTCLGNYGAIIRAIQEHAPQSRIILLKSMWVCNAGSTTPNTHYNYMSGVIETLSSHLGIPYLETYGDAFFCSDYYTNGLKGLHPTAPLYAGIAKRVGELVGKCVIENHDYFYNFYIPHSRE